MTATAEILKYAKSLIESPESWWDGKPKTRTANNVCAGIALDKARTKANASSKDAYRVLAFAITGETVNDTSVSTVISYNDTHTHAEVLAKFDEAIASLQ